MRTQDTKFQAESTAIRANFDKRAIADLIRELSLALVEDRDVSIDISLDNNYRDAGEGKQGEVRIGVNQGSAQSITPAR